MTDYFTLADLAAIIPAKFLRQALDDDQDGESDPAVITALQKTVKADIDSRLGKRYATPFENPLPAVVAHAAVTLACAACYRRRGVSDENNPHAKEEAEVREKLDAIGNGKEPLETGRDRKQPSASVVTSDAKTVAGEQTLA